MAYREVPTDLGFEQGPLTMEQYSQMNADIEEYLNQPPDEYYDNSISARDLDIMVHGYDRDDWRACAARDYEHEALRSIERAGGRVIW